jgi:hypothetical protein
MSKAKAHSSNTVLCSCGCGDNVSKRMQTHHLQGRGPVMAVVGVIETKAYFRKRGAEAPESPWPQKHQRVIVPVLDTPDNVLLVLSPPMTVDPPSGNLLASEAAQTALSGPWTGPADFRPSDDNVFEDSNDISNDRVLFDPIVQDPHMDSELETSDIDSVTVSRLVPFGHVFGPLLSSFRTKFTCHSSHSARKTTKTFDNTRYPLGTKYNKERGISKETTRQAYPYG